MPRRPRIEFEGAIYHVMARGNARQRIVRDDHDRERLLDDLRRTVLRWAVENQATAGKGLPSDFVSPFNWSASETAAATA